jgi:hypothetical protein
MPNSLYWDGKSDPSDPDGDRRAAERSEGAGCGPNNRCFRPPYGGFADEYGCSQFPFVSCLPNNEVGYPSINRCVPKAQSDGMCILIPHYQSSACVLILPNAAQDHVIDSFYHSNNGFENTGMGGNPDWFKIAFSNTGSIKYC